MTNVEQVQALRESLPSSYEWTGRDLALLDLAEAQARDLDALEGDDRMAAVRERRQGRAVLGRLLGQIDVPAEPSTGALHARRAAQARWGA